MFPRKRDPHDWNSLENYLAVHDKCMDGFSEFIVQHDLEFRFPRADTLNISGSISCLGGLVIHIDKTLDINGRHQVRGKKYKYQAQFADPPTREIFRYDNAHSYPGHPDDFHRHEFDTRTWRIKEPPEHIGRQDWPTLSDVIEELRDWRLAHRDDPDIFPP